MPTGTVRNDIYEDSVGGRAGFIVPDTGGPALRFEPAGVVPPATLDSVRGRKVTYTESLGGAIDVRPAGP